MDYKAKFISLINDESLPIEQRKKLEEIFNACKESEDARIRRDIISYIQVANQFIPQFQKDKWITWLEKQGEQAVISHKFNVGDWIVSKWGGIYQIKEVMSGSYNLLCTNNAEEINSITQVDNNSRLLCIDDIKKLEKQGKQKPKWSDEDENFFANICSMIDADRNFTESAKRRCKEWLKSLKKRMEE